MFSNKAQTDKLIELFKKGTRLTYSKGEYIIRPGESPGGVYYIESGLVKAYDITKYGEENLLQIRKNHEIFPLIWSITGEDIGVIYQALSATTVWRLSAEEYNKALRAQPEVLLPFVDIIIEMYRLHSARIMGLQYRTVRERLVSFLLTMANRFGEKAENGTLINVPLRHQDIASSINASRETTTRELIALEKKNLVINHPPYLTLTDTKALEKIL